MAVIDEEHGHLVVRVVYDGPPLSGKTTSLRTLAEGLGATVLTPEEHEGRTLYFDWVDYVGGMFEGRQIHCQILSVPGQLELAPRRHALLRSADVVVLVADTRKSEFPAATALLELTARWCRDQSPPVGMVVQANKRDSPDAIEREVMLDAVRAIAPIAVVETVATEGDGVRESFVFAVRLALDRVRALASAGALTGTDEVESADEVETQLSGLQVNSITQARRDDRGAVQEPTARKEAAPQESAARNETLATSSAQRPRISFSRREERPFRPDPHMPGGLIWPPVDGRALLHDLARHPLQPRREVGGGWVAEVDSWRCRSGKDQYFADLEQGRAALIQSARLHSSNGRLLSAGRIVVLADAGEDHYRLWQLYRAVPTLADTLAALSARDSPRHVADSFIDVGRSLRAAAPRFQVHALPCMLDTVSAEDGRYAADIGRHPVSVHGASQDRALEELVRRELSAPFQEHCQARSDVPSIRQELLRAATQNEPTASILLTAIG